MSVPPDFTNPEEVIKAFNQQASEVLGGFASSQAQEMVKEFSQAWNAIAQQAMETTHIAHLSQRQIGRLSGGQLQRVLIARALACQPKILILDEPTANIDQRVEEDIFDLLKTLNKELTIMVVSHDIGFISAYVNRVACLNKTLLCHHTASITSSELEQLYNIPVRAIQHQHY